MHVDLQYVGVHLDFKRRDGRAVFFCEHLPSGGSNACVDLLKQFPIEPGDVVPQGLMAEDFGPLASRGGGQTEHLADQHVMIRQVLQAIPVGIQAQADDAQNEDLPQVHAEATGGLFAG